jgi:hypothetical protein
MLAAKASVRLVACAVAITAGRESPCCCLKVSSVSAAPFDLLEGRRSIDLGR